MRLFSLFCIAASHTVHVDYYSCVLLHICIVTCHVCILFLNTLYLTFFSIDVENVVEYCKAQ